MIKDNLVPPGRGIALQAVEWGQLSPSGEICKL